jgi:Lon protease-like protein
VLFNTLLAGDPDVEEGLVQEDSPFAGSKRFGMAYVDESGRLSAVGTTLQVQDFIRQSDGRMCVAGGDVVRVCGAWDSTWLCGGSRR